ncbi:MAG: MobC family plasmid mobilization relaxosome protein [Ruminococcus sp.]|nr:MobC family plasmid mobilization relaxosome protein [Ruminococcus sp.]
MARRDDQLRRKEIVYTVEEWKQIEDKAEKCHLKTATFIRAMSLNGDVYVVDLKELAPLLNGMRIISNNVNQVARKANETNSIYAEDVEKLRGEVSRISRTVNQWLSTTTFKKL